MHSKRVPLRITSAKEEEAVRAVPLLERLRMRAFAIEKLSNVREWVKQWNKRIFEENNTTSLESCESYGSAYVKLYQVTKQVHKRLSDLQAHVDKHIKQKTQHGDRLKQLTTREDNNAVTVLELDFERQKQLEDLKAAHEQSHNKNPWNTTRDEQRNEQAQETGAEDAQQQSLHQATVTRTKKLVGQELLDELDALQNGRSDGSFLYSYFDKKETAVTYKKYF